MQLSPNKSRPIHRSPIKVRTSQLFPHNVRALSDKLVTFLIFTMAKHIMTRPHLNAKSMQNSHTSVSAENCKSGETTYEFFSIAVKCDQDCQDSQHARTYPPNHWSQQLLSRVYVHQGRRNQQHAGDIAAKLKSEYTRIISVPTHAVMNLCTSASSDSLPGPDIAKPAPVLPLVLSPVGYSFWEPVFLSLSMVSSTKNMCSRVKESPAAHYGPQSNHHISGNTASRHKTPLKTVSKQHIPCMEALHHHNVPHLHLDGTRVPHVNFFPDCEVGGLRIRDRIHHKLLSSPEVLRSGNIVPEAVTDSVASMKSTLCSMIGSMAVQFLTSYIWTIPENASLKTFKVMLDYLLHEQVLLFVFLGQLVVVASRFAAVKTRDVPHLLQAGTFIELNRQQLPLLTIPTREPGTPSHDISLYVGSSYCQSTVRGYPSPLTPVTVKARHKPAQRTADLQTSSEPLIRQQQVSRIIQTTQQLHYLQVNPVYSNSATQSDHNFMRLDDFGLFDPNSLMHGGQVDHQTESFATYLPQRPAHAVHVLPCFLFAITHRSKSQVGQVGIYLPTVTALSHADGSTRLPEILDSLHLDCRFIHPSGHNPLHFVLHLGQHLTQDGYKEGNIVSTMGSTTGLSGYSSVKLKLKTQSQVMFPSVLLEQFLALSMAGDPVRSNFPGVLQAQQVKHVQAGHSEAPDQHHRATGLNHRPHLVASPVPEGWQRNSQVSRVGVCLPAVAALSTADSAKSLQHGWRNNGGNQDTCVSSLTTRPYSAFLSCDTAYNTTNSDLSSLEISLHVPCASARSQKIRNAKGRMFIFQPSGRNSESFPFQPVGMVSSLYYIPLWSTSRDLNQHFHPASRSESSASPDSKGCRTHELANLHHNRTASHTGSPVRLSAHHAPQDILNQAGRPVPVEAPLHGFQLLRSLQPSLASGGSLLVLDIGNPNMTHIDAAARMHSPHAHETSHKATKVILSATYLMMDVAQMFPVLSKRDQTRAQSVLSYNPVIGAPDQQQHQGDQIVSHPAHPSFNVMGQTHIHNSDCQQGSNHACKDQLQYSSCSAAAGNTTSAVNAAIVQADALTSDVGTANCRALSSSVCLSARSASNTAAQVTSKNTDQDTAVSSPGVNRVQSSKSSTDIQHPAVEFLTTTASRRTTRSTPADVHCDEEPCDTVEGILTGPAAAKTLQVTSIKNVHGDGTAISLPGSTIFHSRVGEEHSSPYSNVWEEYPHINSKPEAALLAPDSKQPFPLLVTNRSHSRRDEDGQGQLVQQSPRVNSVYRLSDTALFTPRHYLLAEECVPASQTDCQEKDGENQSTKPYATFLSDIWASSSYSIMICSRMTSYRTTTESLLCVCTIESGQDGTGVRAAKVSFKERAVRSNTIPQHEHEPQLGHSLHHHDEALLGPPHSSQTGTVRLNERCTGEYHTLSLPHYQPPLLHAHVHLAYTVLSPQLPNLHTRHAVASTTSPNGTGPDLACNTNDISKQKHVTDRHGSMVTNTSVVRSWVVQLVLQDILARRLSPPDQDHQQHTDLLYHGHDYEWRQLIRYEESLPKQANSNLQVNVLAYIASKSAVFYLRLTCPGQLLSWHNQQGTSLTLDLLHEAHLPLVNHGHIRPRLSIHTLWAISLISPKLLAMMISSQEILLFSPPTHHVQGSMQVVSVLHPDSCKHGDQLVLHHVPHSKSKVQHAALVRLPRSHRIRVASFLSHAQQGHDQSFQHHLQVTEVTIYIKPQATDTYLSRMVSTSLRVCLAFTTCNTGLLPTNSLLPSSFAGMLNVLADHTPEQNGLGPLLARHDRLQHPLGWLHHSDVHAGLIICLKFLLLFNWELIKPNLS